MARLQRRGSRSLAARRERTWARDLFDIEDIVTLVPRQQDVLAQWRAFQAGYQAPGITIGGVRMTVMINRTVGVEAIPELTCGLIVDELGDEAVDHDPIGVADRGLPWLWWRTLSPFNMGATSASAVGFYEEKISVMRKVNQSQTLWFVASVAGGNGDTYGLEVATSVVVILP